MEKEIMEKEIMDLFEDYWTDGRYIVEDATGRGKVKLLLVLESPHNDEVKNGYPVAGRSGIDMAWFLGLSDGKESLGSIASSESSKGIGIMNISRVPLQKVNGLDMKYDEFVERLDRTVRCGYGSLQRHRGNRAYNMVEERLMADFKSRYEKVDFDEDAMVVVCGAFAKKYFEMIGEVKQKVHYVPHPSRNQWRKGSESLFEFREEFQNNCAIS